VGVTPGEPVVEGETVTFPVTATAAQIRVLDPDTVREEIQGKPIAEARSILEQYGQVELTVWPDWVSVIPTIDGRVDIRVVLPEGLDAPSSSPSPAASGSPEPSRDARSASPATPGSASPPAGASSEPSVSLDPGLGGESPPP
jgi:hypothetical protein